MYNDPISDMLNRMRNAILVKHEKVLMPHSKMKEKIASIFKEEGLIKDYSVEYIVARKGSKKGPKLSKEELKKIGKKSLKITLKYFSKNRDSVIRVLKRISKPGRRVYTTFEDMPRVLGGIGVAILSTSKGVSSDKVCRKNRVGGEVLCYVW